MPSWNRLLNTLDGLPNDATRITFVKSESLKYLREISRLRGALLHGSGRRWNSPVPKR